MLLPALAVYMTLFGWYRHVGWSEGFWEDCLQVSSKSRSINHITRKLVSVFDHPQGKDNFPNVQSEPPLAHLCRSHVSSHW